MNNTPKKRGRPAGSTSFSKIKLKDLADQLSALGMTNQVNIVVSKRWLEDIGLTIDPPPVKTETIQEATEPEEKIQFSVNTFE